MNLRGLPVLLLLAGSACRARLPVDRPIAPRPAGSVATPRPEGSAPAALPLVAAHVEYYQISDG